MYQLTKTKRSPLLKFLGIILVISVALELTRTFLSSPPVDEQMARASNEINKHCPMMVDSITRLDNTIAISGNRFHSNYTFITADKNTVDTLLFQKEMKTSIINSINTDPRYKPFRDNGVSLSATFHDSVGNYICNILVTEKEYKK